MTRMKWMPGALVVLAVGLAAFFTLRSSVPSTPLDEAISAVEERDYFFVMDEDADPSMSAEEAVRTGGGTDDVSVGPVAGLLTHEYPGEGNDLDEQPVYMFVVDDFLDNRGPMVPDHQPSPAPHVVFVYQHGDSNSVIAVPLTD